jgi:hypothetical protein
MPAGSPTEVTALLEELRKGVPPARDRLAEFVYTRLHQMAAGQLAAERNAHSLGPTALLHEAFERLLGGDLFLRAPNLRRRML